MPSILPELLSLLPRLSKSDQTSLLALGQEQLRQSLLQRIVYKKRSEDDPERLWLHAKQMYTRERRHFQKIYNENFKSQNLTEGDVKHAARLIRSVYMAVASLGLQNRFPVDRVLMRHDAVNIVYSSVEESLRQKAIHLFEETIRLNTMLRFGTLDERDLVSLERLDEFMKILEDAMQAETVSLRSKKSHR